ncbi:hypothetical protein [Enterococcus crotali]
MKQQKTKNRSAFLIERSIDGYVVVIDDCHVKKRIFLINKINRVGKNSSNQIFHNEITLLKK